MTNFNTKTPPRFKTNNPAPHIENTDALKLTAPKSPNLITKERAMGRSTTVLSYEESVLLLAEEHKFKVLYVTVWVFF